MVLLNPGDEVIIPQPYWVTFPTQVEICGAKPVFLDTRETGYRLLARSVERLVTPKTKAIIINSPNNPTGALYQAEELQKIAQLAIERGFWIIFDECYAELIRDGSHHQNIVELCPVVKAQTVLVNSFSKSHALSEPVLLQQLRSQLKAYPNLEWDERPDPLAAMADSDVLLSDISGIVFDYAFLTEKPVVTLDFIADKRGFEASDLPYEPWELRVLDIVGRRVRDEELPLLPAILAEEVGDSKRTAAIRQLRQESVINFGQAAASVVDQLETLLAQAPAIKLELVES